MFKLSSEHCLTSEKKKQEMRRVPNTLAIGSLVYNTVCTRPDITNLVGIVSGFLSNPSKENWTIVKWILKYLKSTFKACLCFGGDKPMLKVYIDAYIVENVDSRKFLSGYLLIFVETIVSW